MQTPNARPSSSIELARDNTIGGLTREGRTSSSTQGVEDPFWQHSSTIDGTRWNKSYPYQLLVLRKVGTKYVEQPNWRFTLPIPPEELTLTTPFAISTQVTQGGIVEEHNGAPIRLITARGSTGVNPLKGFPAQPTSLGLSEAIFAGTISAATRTAQSASSLVDQSTRVRPNLLADEDMDYKSTGYYQFRLLQKFLESYVALKKTSHGQDQVLAFAIWKDQAVYLVTPVSFDVRRAIPKVFKYSYGLTFKAWKRIRLDGTGDAAFDLHQPVARDPSALANLMNRLQDARRTLQGLKGILQAVRGDINASLFDPLRELSLFVKDTLGVPIAAADLPAAIIRDMRGALLEAVTVAQGPAAVAAAFRNLSPSVAGEIADTRAQLQQLSVSSGKAQTRGGDPVGSSQNTLGAAGLDPAHPANKALDNPGDHYELFAAIRPGDLNLPPAVIRKIAGERERVRALSRKDFEELRDDLLTLLADLSDAVGAGHETYSETFGRATSTSTRVPTPDDFDALHSLNGVILELNKLAASGTVDPVRLSALDYVAGLAQKSGIAFQVPRGKYPVPFPYGSTLEMVAARYLGDPNRWHEIAVLNGLRAPFVDEEGFTLTLLSNGKGNQVAVSDVSKLFVGQSVWISSSTKAKTKRKLVKIDQVSSGVYLLDLDGDADLDQYTTQASATLLAFTPNTVNSQMMIYIPTDEEPETEDFKRKSIPGVDELDTLVRVGGVDLLLTQNGDLAVTPDGDCRLAVGLTNLVQWARVALSTVQGSWLQHPGFGLNLQIGASVADVTAEDLLQSARDLFLENRSFTGVQHASVFKNGPTVKLGLQVGIAEVNTVMPLTVDVSR